MVHHTTRKKVCEDRPQPQWGSLPFYGGVGEFGGLSTVRHGLDLLQADHLASGASIFRRGCLPSDEVARDRSSSRAILNPTKDFIESLGMGPQ